MSSTSSCNGKSKSKRSISSCPTAKRSRLDQSLPVRSKKSVDLRATLNLSSPSTSNDIQEPSQLRPTQSDVGYLEPKIAYGACNDVKTSTLSILKTLRDNGIHYAPTITGDLNRRSSREHHRKINAYPIPTTSTTFLSKEEVVLSIIDRMPKATFNPVFDCNATVDLTDLGLQRALNICRNSSQLTDCTRVEETCLEEYEFPDNPHLKAIWETVSYNSVGLESSSNGEMPFIKLEDENTRPTTSGATIFDDLHITPSGDIIRPTITRECFVRRRLERLKKFQAGFEGNDQNIPPKQFGYNNGHEMELNVIPRMSDSNALDQRESLEEKNLPESECPSTQNEQLIESRMVNQTKVPAIDTKIEGVVHSHPQTITIRSPLDADNVKMQHTGTLRHVESLSALGGHRRQFGKLQLRPSVQKQLRVTEEMFRSFTRATKPCIRSTIPKRDVFHSVNHMLSKNKPEAIKKVLSRLLRITTKRVCDLIKFFKCGVFDQLLRLLVHFPEDDCIQNLVMRLLAELSIIPDCRVQLLSCRRLILQCINLLKDDKASLHLQECASKIISAAATDKVFQLSLSYEHHLGEVLLQKIMETPDPDIQSNCMEIMLRMIKNRPACKRLINCDLFTLNTFRMLLGSEYFKIKQITLGLLVLITRYETEEAFQEKINKSGLPQIMMTILQTEAMCDFYHLVIEILCNIANTAYGLNLLQNSGVIAFLVDYIHTAGKDDLLGCGLDIIVKLSGSPLGRTDLVELKIPARLVKYLKIKNDTILERSCVTISNLSEHLGAVNEMVAEKPAEDLIRLIFEDNVAQIKFAASRAMYELAIRDETMCQYVAKLHLTEAFHQIIWSGFTHIQTLSIISDTIQILSHYPYLRFFMTNSESMACFLDIIQGYSRKREVSEDLLGGEETLRVSALQCLRCYMSEPECRKLFMKASGVYVVRSTLQSPSIRIKQATALFIELAARDPALTKAMVIAGIIPIMMRDTQMKLTCPDWEKALNQMYNHHLPSKFAYCNRLDITDITSEGFYVAATQRGQIQVLDNLLNDKKCPMEIIYVCNFASEHPVPDRCDLMKTCPDWYPWQINALTYPSGLGALGARNMATIWQHKANLLFGDSPNESYDNSLNVPHYESLSLGQNTKRLISSVNQLLKERMNRQGGSLAPLDSNYHRPLVGGQQINSSENFGVCPVDHELRDCWESVRSELFVWLIREGKYCAGYPYDFVAEAGVVSVAKILAMHVAHRMSGDGKHGPNIGSFCKSSLWDLKVYFKSSILPLGYLKAGLHLERALLFKVLADKVGLPCTLVRGKFGMAYNEICVPCDNNEFPIPPQKMIPNHVVDLMDHPGRVYFIPSREAFGYCQIPY